MLLSPSPDCSICPRLVAFRHANRREYPDFFNAPVPSFGELDAALLIVGLAPGLKGANRTGRPFTGDYAGLILYHGLLKAGLAAGNYGEAPDDGLRLTGCRITNAVRCVPPANKPEAAEIKTCRRFLAAEIAAMPQLRAILALGRIAHQSVLAALDKKQNHRPFAHGAAHDLGALTLFDSYHCSRYNIHTGRLTSAMFNAAMTDIVRFLARPTQP